MSDLPCKYKIGFLFKRVCGRSSRVGCKYCRGAALESGKNLTDEYYDPYFRDRTLYSRDRYLNSNFTDYDARGLSTERDTDYETDLDAS